MDHGPTPHTVGLPNPTLLPVVAVSTGFAVTKYQQGPDSRNTDY